MSLLRLLTSGKSLVGIKKLEQRYRLPAEGALPKFGSKKNPFRATVFPEKCETAEVTNGQPAQSAAESQSPAARADEPSAALEAAVSQADCAEAKAESTIPARNTQESAEQRPSGFRALFLWGRAKKLPRSGPASGRPLVQAELSLETVKVVRNDLSESDLEIVRVERTSKSAVSSVRSEETTMGVPQARAMAGVGELMEAAEL